MPRRALRCVVDLKLHAISAPGVWLPSKEDVYLSVSMFGQYRNSCMLTSVFPVFLHETFRFEKTYYTALDLAEVADYLQDELVIFELVQLSEYCDGAVRLASFSTNARDFLFPFPSLSPSYSSTDREILLSRTVAFPGISPKLEFSTKTVVRESLSPEVDALEDALDYERDRRSYRKARRSPVRRARSPSPVRRYSSLDLSDTIDPRPPFVVRKPLFCGQLGSELIGRVPGGGPDSHARSKGKKAKKLTYSSDDLDLYTSSLRSRSLLRKSLDPLPTYRSKLSDDEDAEVAALTSRPLSSYRPRPRSASPILYRPSFEARYGYGLRTYSPTYYSLVADRALDRLRLSPYYDSTLYDLELSTRLARSRRYYPLY